MSYPTDKEEFRRVVNQDLPDVDGDIVDKDDQNLPADFLERLQDTLGYGIKMGYETVKAFFDYVVAQVALIAGKVNKTGDTMSGNLDLNNGTTAPPQLHFQVSGQPNRYFLRCTADNMRLHARLGFTFWKYNNFKIMDINVGNKTSFFQEVNFQGNDIFRAGNITLDSNHDFISTGHGNGMIVETPDGTKKYRISVDDAGNIISTLQ